MDEDVRNSGGDVVPLRAREDAGQALAASDGTPLILLLQGPVGPFFEHLKRAFEQQGCKVLKVNFNAGDWLSCRGRAILNFNGSPQAWGDWLDAFLQRSRPAAIVLFGDSRPYHRIAIAVAARSGIPVWCLEEGYARPHFVTCELGGNNGSSPLRHAFEGERRGTARALRPVSLVTGNLFRAMAFHATAYAVAKMLGAPFFLGNSAHRHRGLTSETLLWSRNFCRKIINYHANQSFLQNLIEHFEKRYFVVALQVHDDLHLLRHGRGWTMERLITETIQSFARHAAPEHRLVLKVHPMDRGHRSYRAFANRLAALCNCTDRVHVIDDGSIGLLIRHALGVVTVNSTSGLLALNHGKPLLALGDAIYTHQGLTMDGTAGSEAMDRFWRFRTCPDHQRVKFFMRRMHEDSLINGSFYLRDWFAATSEQIVSRVRNNVVQMPSQQPARRQRQKTAARTAQQVADGSDTIQSATDRTSGRMT